MTKPPTKIRISARVSSETAATISEWKEQLDMEQGELLEFIFASCGPFLLPLLQNHRELLRRKEELEEYLSKLRNLQ